MAAQVGEDAAGLGSKCPLLGGGPGGGYCGTGPTSAVQPLTGGHKADLPATAENRHSRAQWGASGLDPQERPPVLIAQDGPPRTDPQG
ncbi:hypothetical protein TREES_T100008344 [Tupaia chinensis]|uniref:Uncharacterized protein n=1 Tax=Tupaia chinensis TaxID=246437 RepID=L9LC05_TUPCH|nr:hypothetical protein TREES_T100008344 [Tupaia chinensis]